MVEVKDDLHVTFREALVVPTHKVVTGPHAVRLGVEEIVLTPRAICQLAEAFRQSEGEMHFRLLISIFYLKKLN